MRISEFSNHAFQAKFSDRFQDLRCRRIQTRRKPNRIGNIGKTCFKAGSPLVQWQIKKIATVFVENIKSVEEEVRGPAAIVLEELKCWLPFRVQRHEFSVQRETAGKLRK